MINLIKIIFTFLTVVVLFGCDNQHALHISEYPGWIENPENGFVKAKEFDEVSFISFYKPPVYRVLKKHQNDGNLNKDSLQNQIDKLEDWYTFTFRVKAKEHPLEQGNQNSQEYFQKLEYYINAQSDFKLIIGESDTIPCAMYHMERNYGGAPYIDINVAFKKENKTPYDITMLYFDRVFSNGPLKFNYHLDETTSLPQYVL